jgi:nitrogen fixation protein FixH
MASAPERRSAWIPWAFIGFMAFVVVVNGVMVYFALSTFTGTTVDRAYERGRLYNEVLAEAERQASFGWRFELAWTPSGDPLAGRIVVAATDRDGAPLEGLAIEGRVLRPLGRPEPIPLAFAQAGSGRYVVPVMLDGAGQWEVRLAARRGRDGPVELRERIIVR